MLNDTFLSPQTISAVAEIISGGSSTDSSPPIGLYRSAYKLHRFMLECNVHFEVGNGSRVPTLLATLRELQTREDAREVLTRVIEHSADPRDFANSPEKHTAVIDYLNKYLAYDELELRRVGNRMQLTVLGRGSAVVNELARKAETIDFDTVRRDLERALESAETDPEDAVTAACSTIESVCRSILLELGLPLPDKLDLPGLYKAVRDPLALSPTRTDLPIAVAEDVRNILSGLITAIQGIGSLRTHAGDAHGRERGFNRIDARIARLAINSASTATLFLIETWERKYPDRELYRH